MERMMLAVLSLKRYLPVPAPDATLPPPDLLEDRANWSAHEDARWYYERRSFIG